MNTHFFSDTAVLLGRSLRHITRSMDTFGEAGQFGVTEPVRVAEPDWPSVAVGDLGDVAELAQHPVVGAGWVGFMSRASRANRKMTRSRARLPWGVSRPQRVA